MKAVHDSDVITQIGYWPDIIQVHRDLKIVESYKHALQSFQEIPRFPRESGINLLCDQKQTEDEDLNHPQVRCLKI